MVTTSVNDLTFEEYLNYDDDEGCKYELVDGKLEIMNPPVLEHFLIAKWLEKVLDTEINRLNLDWLCLRETGVRTGRKKSRLPDLAVVNIEQAKELKNQSVVFQTPPLLIIEIVSPESVKRDYRYKRSEYAALAVPEYWIVDPTVAKISILLLEEGLYEEQIFTDNQQIISRIFPKIMITPERVFLAGNL